MGKKEKSLLGKRGKETQSQGQSNKDLSSDVQEVERDINVLEDRISNIDKKTEVIESNLVDINKKYGVEIKTIHSKLLELEKEVDVLKKKFTEMSGDLKNFARKQNVDSLKKYIDLWKPIDFITRKEVDEIIDEKLREKLEKFK